MWDAAEKVTQLLVDRVSFCCGYLEEEVEDDVKAIVHELLDHISFCCEPLEKKLDFFSLDYRKAPSLASASSFGDSELGDITDGELPFLASDEDSDREFEKLQHFTYESRKNIFRREHLDGTPLNKKSKPAFRLDDSDLCHEYDNLPPLEGLTIHCEKAIPLKLVGHVASIVDCLVVIQSVNGVALDIDSVLFDKNRKSIGVVYDLFGPVKNPLYSIRFNTKEEASRTDVGMEVYYAPDAEKYTRTIIEIVKKEVVSDEDDLLDDEVAFSDDEKEKEYRARKMAYLELPRRGGQKRNTRFSGYTADMKRGGCVGARRGDNSGRSWNWHNDCSRTVRRRCTKRHSNRIEETLLTSTSAGMDNPYADYECFSSISFVDTREL